MPDDRRALIARVSQAEPLAYLSDLPIKAYASAVRERRDGASDLVTVLLVRGDQARVRAALSDRLSLRWEQDAQPCGDGECPLRARFVRPDGAHRARQLRAGDALAA